MVESSTEQSASEMSRMFAERLFTFSSAIELAVVVAVYVVAWLLTKRWLSRIASRTTGSTSSSKSLGIVKANADKLLFSLLSVFLLGLMVAFHPAAMVEIWLIRIAFYVSFIAFFFRATNLLVAAEPAQTIVRLIGLSAILLHFFKLSGDVVTTLDALALEVGNFRLSFYGFLRIIFVGFLLFWLGRLSNKAGQVFIRKQNQLDFRTRELLAKLFELSLFFVGFLLLLQVVGINLTALAVFGGALGIGLGIGLQAIASNFISGLIILLDRSVSLGDYLELEDGRSGTVTQQNLRSTTLETFDARNIVVPNETFITTSFTNWTHKNAKQRYRVDFSVAYNTDVRSMVEIIKAAVAEHPSVLSGDGVPIEERPDCEIDSFGDSGINMFVEFWMEGIDDGRNRVGGDLLLIILETLQSHGIEIPFPQREVRILKDDANPAVKKDHE